MYASRTSGTAATLHGQSSLGEIILYKKRVMYAKLKDMFSIMETMTSTDISIVKPLQPFTFLFKMIIWKVQHFL